MEIKFQGKEKNPELCGDCKEYGKCMYDEELEKKPSSPTRKTFSGASKRDAALADKSSKTNEQVVDLENWQPHNLTKLRYLLIN